MALKNCFLISVRHLFPHLLGQQKTLFDAFRHLDIVTLTMAHRKLFNSNQISKFYAMTRPTPPPELIKELVKRCSGKRLAVDVGCGTGQVASLLAPFFDQVIGVDTSPTQIAEAKELNNSSNVDYIVGHSESLVDTLKGIKTETDANFSMATTPVDAITCSQALHWMDINKSLEQFKNMVENVGVFGAITYEMPFLRSSESGTNIDENFIREQIYRHPNLKFFWDSNECLYIDNNYENINFEDYFKNVNRIVDEFKSRISLKNQKHFLDNHLNSWSPIQRLKNEDADNYNELINDVIKTIPKDDETVDKGLYLEYTGAQ